MSRVRSTAAVVLAAGLLAACGGGGGVSAEEYARQVCSAGNRWQDRLQTSLQELQQSLGPNATPAQGKEQLGVFLDSLVEDTETLIERTEEIGVPDADNGEEAHDRFLSVFRQVRDVFEDARTQVEELPTNDPQAFQAAASQIGQSLQESGQNLQQQFGEIDSDELDQAFDEVEACQEFGSAS